MVEENISQFRNQLYNDSAYRSGHCQHLGSFRNAAQNSVPGIQKFYPSVTWCSTTGSMAPPVLAGLPLSVPTHKIGIRLQSREEDYMDPHPPNQRQLLNRIGRLTDKRNVVNQPPVTHDAFPIGEVLGNILQRNVRDLPPKAHLNMTGEESSS